jgi:hypothetical protein
MPARPVVGEQVAISDIAGFFSSDGVRAGWGVLSDEGRLIGQRDADWATSPAASR